MSLQFDNSGKLVKPTAEELAAADADSAIIVLNTGTIRDGIPYWAYIAVKPSRYEEFDQKTKQGQPMVLSEYGQILKYGFDAEVPYEVKEEMRRDYNFDEQYLAVLQDKALAEQAVFLKQKEEKRINDIVAMLKKKQAK